VYVAITTTGVGWVQVLGILLAATLLPDKREAGFAGRLGANMRRWGWRLIAAFLVSGALSTLLLKQVLPRERPSNLAWANPHELIYHDSFPSGHTTTSFGIAWLALLLTSGTDKGWLGWLAILWASLVGYSRVYLGVHWPTDVVAGALVGLVGACAVFAVFKRAPDLESTSTQGDS
jgi:undecaprenyl-diphosphatase